MSCDTCGTNCSASCEDVRQILEQTLYTWLSAGKLQAGLLSCENGRLKQDTAVVLCTALAELVQEGIDSGNIKIPLATSITSDGTVVTVRYNDGRTLDFDMQPVLDTVPIVTATGYDADGHITITLSDGTIVRSATSLKPILAGIFKSCDGGDIAPGATLATCDNMNLSLQGLEAEIKRFVEEEFLLTLSKVRLPVLTDMETLQGNGLPSDKIRMNKVWLDKRIKEVIHYVDCEGEDILPGQALVTCVLFNEYITSAGQALTAQRIKSLTYAAGKVTITLNDGTTFTADISAVNTYVESGSLTGRTLTLKRNDGTTFDIDLNTFAVMTSGTVVTGTGTAEDPIKFKLSAGAGNLLQVRDDGLYYGIEAPADISTLYVDSLLGSDENKGTRDAPFKTYGRALNLITGLMNQTIYLHAGNDRPEYVATRGLRMNTGRLSVWAYGDTYIDGAIAAEKYALQSPECPYYNPWAALAIQRPRIRFTVAYQPQVQLLGVQGFSVGDGAAIHYRGVKIMGSCEVDPARPWASNGSSTHYGSPNGVLAFENSIYEDDTPEAQVPTRLRTWMAAPAVDLGMPQVQLVDSQYSFPLRERPSSCISSPDKVVWRGAYATSPCMNVPPMYDNFITAIDQYGADSVITGIILDSNGSVILPTSNKDFSRRMIPTGGTPGQQLTISATGTLIWA